MIKRIILFVYLLFISFGGFSQEMTEILGRPTDNSITVSALFTSQVEVYFEYGTIKGQYPNTSQTFTSGPDNPVEADLIDLQAGTRYFYRTRFRKIGESTFLASEIHTFITQRKRGTSFRFTIEADPHPYDKKGCWPLWDIALANQLKDTADFIIDMGDTFGDDHNPFTITNEQVKQLQLNCRTFFGKVCHSMPLYFCIGNHEGESGYYLLQTPPNNLATYETLWRKLYYPNPYLNDFYSGNNQEETNGMGKPENYYAWEWGDALFVVLDMYRYASINEKPQKWDWTIGKDQYDWFKQTLENSTAKYKFVFSHHILGQGRGGIELAKSFEWGGYDASTYKFDTYRPGWGLPIHQLMKENHVNIYFQGHDHIYVKQELDGIIYQSVPMPSDSSYKIGITDNGDAYLSGKQLGGSGHLRVTVTTDSVNVDFVNALLPKDETAFSKNADVLYSYSINQSGTTSSGNEFNLPLNEWSVFPNPSGEEINISVNQHFNESLTIQIVNMDGKIVKQFEHSKILNVGNPLNIKLKYDNGNNLLPGVYIVSIIQGRNKISSKSIIIR